MMTFNNIYKLFKYDVFIKFYRFLKIYIDFYKVCKCMNDFHKLFFF